MEISLDAKYVERIEANTGENVVRTLFRSYGKHLLGTTP